MVKIRLQRFGSHKAPFYRIVVAESTRSRDGKFLERIGEYSPIKKYWTVNKEAALKWLSQGAQPTTTVKSIFRKESIVKNKEIQK